ncbi:hypothetical protein [Micromonospora tulbaghiae]|uniref:hypothetical protein n=1 Tax=Micromonospora tulbaghiae TaxID=479978 RepID=UPI0033F9384E
MTDFDELVGAQDGFLAEGIALTHDGHPIKSISRTCLAIWNHKGDVISRSDVLVGDPLRVEFDEKDRVLQARIIAISRAQNGFSARIDESDPKAVSLDFDFLDSGDGIVLEVIHQGETAGGIVGTIRGSSVVYAGRKDLSLSTLRSLANESKLKRFRQYWFSSRSGIVSFAVFVSAILFVAPWTVWDASRKPPFRDPSLVDVSKFDLTSFKGQSAFAEKVLQVGLPGLSGLLVNTGLPIMSLVMILVVARALSKPTRQIVPPEILREFVVHSSFNSENFAEGDDGVRKA